MRLDEWQQFIETQFLEDVVPPAPVPLSTPVDTARKEVRDADTGFVPALTPDLPVPSLSASVADSVSMKVEATADTQKKESARSSRRFGAQSITMHPVLDESELPERTIRLEAGEQNAVLEIPAQITDVRTSAPTPVLEPPPIAPPAVNGFVTISGKVPPEEQPVVATEYALLTPPPSTYGVGLALFGDALDLNTDLPRFEDYLHRGADAVVSATSRSAPDAPLEIETQADGTIPFALVAPAPDTKANNSAAPVESQFPPLTAYEPVTIVSHSDSITTLSFDVIEPAIGSPTPDVSADGNSAEGEMIAPTSLRRARRPSRQHLPAVADGPIPGGATMTENQRVLEARTEWPATIPHHLQTLLALEHQEEQAEAEVAQSSYKRPFQETRHELIARLLDPILSLEETARLLNVCPTTVRRYTNRGVLNSYRKEPQRAQKAGAEELSAGAQAYEKETRQRRFRLSDIVAFLEAQSSALEADRLRERAEGTISA